MKKKILVTLPVNSGHKEYLADCLAGHEDEAELVYTDGAEPSPELLGEADVLLGIYNASWVKHAKKVSWIQLASAGYDAFRAPGVLPEGVLLTCAVGAYGLSVSEHMLAQTFYMIRKFGPYSRNQAESKWQGMGEVASIEGSVILVMGMGDIGSSYARKVKALGAYVIGIRKNSKPKPAFIDDQYTIDELDKVLPRADIVAMILPGGEDTYHLMDGHKLNLMKEGSFLLNAGRGNSLDPAALKSALRAGRLRGVALDVTEPEPLPSDDELWSMENVFITPHVAGGLNLPETLNRIVKIIGENLTFWLNGDQLKNQV